MRTIKFRGKMIDTGQWIFGDLLQNGSITHISNFDNGVNREHYEVDPATVGQFTDLFDKNGKEIWENDILSGYGFKYEVIYFQPYAQFMATNNGLVYNINTDNEIEVIGNVHENPELL